MRHSRRHLLASYLSLLSVLALAIFAPSIQDGSAVKRNPSRMFLGAVSQYGLQTQEDRIAYRLQYRLYRRGHITPPLSVLSRAIAQRQRYLKNSVVAHVLDHTGKKKKEVNISIHAHPLWLKPDFSITNASYSIDKEAIAAHLRSIELENVFPPEHVVLSNIIEEEDDVLRAETSGVAKGGIQLNYESGATLVFNALLSGEKEINLQLEVIAGAIQNETGEDLGNLELIASGRSNFAGSTYGRTQNVRKALRTHVNNTLVPPGETFSFNSTLGGPVTLSRGWYMAKVIFGGDELKPAAGGGICQASTTVYRAIINAGFPVVERRAHSLYVSYYKKHGVGIDATIYPGSQDLVFLNDSENTLLIQAYDDGYEAVVNIYGTPDGRSVELEGPYFSTNAPEDFLVHNRAISQNEVAWVQRVEYKNGTIQKNTILSRYKELPRYVKQEYAFRD